jgi:hypothetical protein
MPEEYDFLMSRDFERCLEGVEAARFAGNGAVMSQ